MADMPETPFYLSANAHIAAAAEGAQPGARFTGELYSGGPVHGNVYVDLGTLTIEPSVPVLFQHDPSRLVGLFSQLDNQGTRLAVAGELFDGDDADAKAIAAKAARGVKWQMSMGVFDYSWEDIPAGKTFSVNGREAAGPATVLRNGLLREGSICALGADKNTNATFFSHRAERPPIPQPSPEGAHMPTQAEFDDLKAQLQAANDLTAQLQAAAVATAAAQREVEVKALFAELGRPHTPEAAQPYMALSAESFAALAADLRTHHKPAALSAGLTQSAFAATAPADPAAGSVLLANARATYGIK